MKQAIFKVFETAPYVRSRITTGDLMYFVVLALLPCAGMGIYRYGFHAALLIGISVGCAFVLEFLCDLIWKKRAASVMDYSCIVTGLVCGLILDTSGKNARKNFELQLNLLEGQKNAL